MSDFGCVMGVDPKCTPDTWFREDVFPIIVVHNGGRVAETGYAAREIGGKIPFSNIGAERKVMFTPSVHVVKVAVSVNKWNL